MRWCRSRRCCCGDGWCRRCRCRSMRRRPWVERTTSEPQAVRRSARGARAALARCVTLHRVDIEEVYAQAGRPAPLLDGAQEGEGPRACAGREGARRCATSVKQRLQQLVVRPLLLSARCRDLARRDERWPSGALERRPGQRSPRAVRTIRPPMIAVIKNQIIPLASVEEPQNFGTKSSRFSVTSGRGLASTPTSRSTRCTVVWCRPSWARWCHLSRGRGARSQPLSLSIIGHRCAGHGARGAARRPRPPPSRRLRRCEPRRPVARRSPRIAQSLDHDVLIVVLPAGSLGLEGDVGEDVASVTV